MNGKPHIDQIVPRAAIAGGEMQIRGRDFCCDGQQRPKVTFAGVEANLLVSSDRYLVACVPEGATSGDVMVGTPKNRSNPVPVEIGVVIADNLHPVPNPALASTTANLECVMRLPVETKSLSVGTFASKCGQSSKKITCGVG